VATSRTQSLLADHAAAAHALTAGFQRALLLGSIFILVAAVIGLRATNTRGEEQQPGKESQAVPDTLPEPARA